MWNVSNVSMLVFASNIFTWVSGSIHTGEEMIAKVNFFCRKRRSMWTILQINEEHSSVSEIAFAWCDVKIYEHAFCVVRTPDVAVNKYTIYIKTYQIEESVRTIKE